MTEDQIKQLITDEVAKQLAATDTSSVSHDEVLETIMFKRPKQWGRRIIKRQNEILLQSTSDAGNTWKDAPIPEFRLILPENNLRSASSNPYAGLMYQNRMQTRSTEDRTLTLSDEIQEIVSSGNLLSITEDKDGIEEVTFMGTYAKSGLTVGQVYQDDNGYLRIVI